ncbi:MAG: TnpV protein [Lachnospiraceae bacterium]|nr:TnpV protein [Lachnospiraceae bacterium]
MSELRERIHDNRNGLDYVLVGDYYIPALKLDEEEERRPIGKWGRMHRSYLKEHRPVTYTEMLLSGRMGAYLADVDEQARARYECIVNQMKAKERVDEELKRSDWWLWVQSMNSIQCRAEEIVLSEIIYF